MRRRRPRSGRRPGLSTRARSRQRWSAASRRSCSDSRPQLPEVGRGYVGGLLADLIAPASVHVALTHALRLGGARFPEPGRLGRARARLRQRDAAPEAARSPLRSELPVLMRSLASSSAPTRWIGGTPSSRRRVVRRPDAQSRTRSSSSSTTTRSCRRAPTRSSRRPVRREPVDQGVSGARNTGVASSAGDIVVFLDDDA